VEDWQVAVGQIVAGDTADSLESATLDFKRQRRSRDDAVCGLAETAACFANAKGGVVVVGVRDRPGGPTRSKAPTSSPTWCCAGSTS